MDIIKLTNMKISIIYNTRILFIYVFLNHLLALDNVFSTKSEEQEVNLVWPNLFLIFDCPSSIYTAHDHDLFRTLSK
jgi:hypothetical protein